MKIEDIIPHCYEIPENKESKDLNEARSAVDLAIYKAGIKEVVEWIEGNLMSSTIINVNDRVKRQSKLREWGIE